MTSMTSSTIGTAFAGAIALLALVACTRQGGVEEGPAAAADTIEGTVRQVGNTPFERTVVRSEEASATVVGEYGDELTRAAGARVRVWGAYRDGDRPERELEATGYEILSVDGAEPRVGTLEHEDGRGYFLVTSGGEEIALTGVPDRLGGRVGAKVWAVLGEQGNVQRYGVLREP